MKLENKKEDLNLEIIEILPKISQKLQEKSTTTS